MRSTSRKGPAIIRVLGHAAGGGAFLYDFTEVAEHPQEWIGAVPPDADDSVIIELPAWIPVVEAARRALTALTRSD